MSDNNQDARLQELAFLAKVEREGGVTVADGYPVPFANLGRVQLVVHLLHEGCLNGPDFMSVPFGYSVGSAASLAGKPNLEADYELQVWRNIASVLTGQQTTLRISHKGRVRRAELEQALRTGRDREQFGIFWEARHRKQAAAIAILSASRASPVSVAYLDMNGLKAINDAYGHAAGDAAIKAYMQTVAMFIGAAEGFRGGSADEVVVVMRETAVDKARETMVLALRQLGKERIVVGGAEVACQLTASCGIASTIDSGEDPDALVNRADAAQRRAKEKSRREQRMSALTVEEQEVEIVAAYPGTSTKA